MGWAGSIEEARQISQLKNKPYAVYFSVKDEYPAVGETGDTVKQYAIAHNNSVPSSIFDLPKVIDQLRGMGVVEFAKVANTKDNRELAEKYEASNYFVVIAAPDGGKIGSWSITGGNLAKTVDAMQLAVEDWKKHQPAVNR